MIWGAENTEYFASRLFDGMEAAYPERWRKFSGEKNTAALVKRRPTPGLVAVIASGGAGSGPLFPGYVADGLADAVAVGGPFAAPNAYCLYELGKQLGSEKGVLLLYNNFAGDFLNNDMAVELLEMDGIPVASLAVTDDIASALGEAREKRSGRCGMGLLMKLAASRAKEGLAPREIAAFLEKANERLGTLSMMTDFEKAEIVYGNGFSGEPGFRTESHMDMERMAREAVEMLVEDLKPRPGEKMVLLINRLRYTGYADSYLVAAEAKKTLEKIAPVAQLRVGSYSNILDVYGFNFSILCASEEMLAHLGEPVYTDSFIL